MLGSNILQRSREVGVSRPFYKMFDCNTSQRKSLLFQLVIFVSMLCSSTGVAELSCKHRSHRQTSNKTDVYIDIVAIADFSCYLKFQNKLNGSREKVKRAMTEHYVSILYAADMKYRSIKDSPYNIYLRLNKLIIAENPDFVPFIETIKRNGKVSGREVMDKLMLYAMTDGKKLLYPSDHIMLFTSYPLTGETDSEDLYTHGLTSIADICDNTGKSASIIRDDRGFQIVSNIAAHELGHSLSAWHDNQNNNCEEKDFFVMSPTPGITNKKMNRTTSFSECSINYFNQHIQKLLTTRNGKTCLLGKLPISLDVLRVTNYLHGQKYTPDQQCSWIEGKDYVWCRMSIFQGSVSEICTHMLCGKMVNNELTCLPHSAAMGTSCGPGKMCIDEKCVSDHRARKNVDKCAFGDQPGVVIDNITCSQVKNEKPHYCQNVEVRARCCASCKYI